MLRLIPKKFGIIAVVLVALTAVIGSAGAQDNSAGLPTNSITVTGFGQAFGSPDIAYVNLGVQTSSTDVVEAFNEANTQMQALIDALKEFGIAERDLQTAGLNMYSDFYDPITGMQTEEPIYRVSNSLSVTVRDVSQVGEVISLGVSSGANSINGLTFGLADPSALEQEARTAAVENARERGQQLADLLGKTLGEPIIVTEVFGMAIPFATNFDRAQSGGLGGAAPIEQGQLSVSVNIQITFSVS
jgi:uncharacterized protein